MIKKNFFEKKYLFNIVLGLIFFLGVYLRLKGYLSNSSLWHDECALAWNIKFRSFSDFFGVLKFDQMAPPLFMILTKVLTKIFGFSEYVFRFLSLCFGCAAIPLFYRLSTKVLNKKFNILVAVFLFAINTSMINYSFEFKPYEIDAFLTMACLLFFINFNVEKSSLKKCLFYGLSFVLLPWISLASVFTIASGFLYIIFQNFKTELHKKAALILPIFVSCLLYLKFYIINNYAHSGYLLDFWYKNFTDRGVKLFIVLLAKNIQYFFDPVKLILFCLIFLFLGVIILFKEKSRFVHLSITSIILLIIASYNHLYPFAERLILFLLPIFLLYMVKPLDLVCWKNKFLSIILIILFALSFYPQIGRTMQFLKAVKFDRKEYPREMMEFMTEKLKPNDIIYVNSSSDADFAYYASFYNIKNIVIQENISSNASEQSYLKTLYSLKSGYYWFFVPIDYIKRPVSNWIEEWAKNQKILRYYKINEKYKSLLLYLYVK